MREIVRGCTVFVVEFRLVRAGDVVLVLDDKTGQRRVLEYLFSPTIEVVSKAGEGR